MKIGIPKEIFSGERRVALTPEVAEKFKKMGFSVLVERGAGATSDYSDENFAQAGVSVVPDAKSLWQQADLILKVRAPEGGETELLSRGKTLISFVWPAQNPELMKKLASTGANVLAMDAVPRISRAQKMDALS